MMEGSKESWKEAKKDGRKRKKGGRKKREMEGSKARGTRRIVGGRWPESGQRQLILFK